MTRLSIYKLIQIITFLISLFTFIIGLINRNEAFLYGSAFFGLLSNSIYSLQKIQNRIVFLTFQITMAIFLLVRPLIGIFDTTLTNNYSAIIIFKTSLIISVSILTMSLVALFAIKSKKTKTIFIDGQNGINKSIRLVSSILYHLTFIVYLVATLEKIIYAQSHTIFEYYNGFQSILPRIFIELSEANLIIFYIYIATFPTKKQGRLIIVLHLLGSLLTLGYGIRNVIVLNSLTLFIYFVIRDISSTGNDKWISKKIAFFATLASPFFIIGLQIIDNIRRGLNAFSPTLIKDFFLSQGITTNTISLTLYHQENIPIQSFPYSFGSITNYISQNIISRILFGIDLISQNSVEMALYGNNLGAALAYLDFPVTYLSGVGMGSSFLAELYFDFSMIGVIIGSVFIMYLMLKIPKMLQKNAYIFAIGLVAIRWIIYIPRDTYTNWIVQSVSILNILTIFVTYIISSFLYHKYFKG